MTLRESAVPSIPGASHEQPKARANPAQAKRARVLQRSGVDARRGVGYHTIPRRPPESVPPASFGQEQLWLHGQLARDIPLYTESLTVHRRAALDADALVAAFREIGRRHEIWRTTFNWVENRLVQQVHADLDPRIDVTDLRHLPESERETAALCICAADLRIPFDLSRESGARARLVTLSDIDHRLYLCLHHMVFDGISIYRVFVRELAMLYDAKVKGVPSMLDELPLQYADFAYWERQSVDEVALQPIIEYWRRQLSGAPTMIDLPTDRPRPRSQSFRGGVVRFEFPRELAAAIRSTALDENCTLFMLLLASFAATLHSWSGQTDLVIGSVSGGRDHPQLDQLVGYFLRMIPIRVDLRGNPTFREMLQRVREVLVDALCHEALPFQRLVQAVARDRDLGCSPLFQVTMSIEPPMPGLGPEWALTEMDAGSEVSKFDLSMELEDHGHVVAVRAVYSRDLFEPTTVSALLCDWRSILERAVLNAGQPLQVLVRDRAGRPDGP